MTEFVEPAYHKHALSDVLPAVATALQVPAFDPVAPGSLTLPDAQSYVVFLVDALGSTLLRRYAHAAPFLSSLVSHPGTAGVPSTTATSLTSFGTALLPGQHGLVGFTSRVPGTGALLNHLLWDQPVDPLEWQPHQTGFGRLAAAGVHVTTVNKREFKNSGLTVAAQRGGEFVGADRVGERIAAALTAAARRPSLTYLYDGDLDWTGHRHGVASTAWLQQLSIIDAEAEQLREALPSSTRLVVVADHGMVDCPTGSRVDVDDHLAMRDGVTLLGGEARFRHLYCQPGAVDDVVATWRATLGERADVLTRDELVDHGWLGPIDPRVRSRVGDVIVACHGDTAIVSTADFPYENTLIGLHGSLTADEMLIPILVA